ncbi:restriction endonuclease subunit S [bacterium]|nr:restriction endonuclease subunit S [bacterium]
MCELNPKRPPLERDDDEPTTFVPMECVDAQSGTIIEYRTRPFVEIKKGYTWFAEGDVLFAKITPCMQNGKHAVARELLGGFGFGTTEFHVLRPREKVVSDFIWHYLRQPSLLQDATEHFTGAVGQQRLPQDYLANLTLPLPPLFEQKRIVDALREQMASVEKARAAAEARLEAANAMQFALIRESMHSGKTHKYGLGDCLVEVKNGVGDDWAKHPVLGATRAGLAPAKETIGKTPERYKLVDPTTVFYNPMRILLGSIAMVDEGDPTGITSPDYVVVKGRPGLLDTRWFYYWFRSVEGAHLIDSLSRGAVRERILFKRLAKSEIEVPDYKAQLSVSHQLKNTRNLVESIAQERREFDALPSALVRRALDGAT